MIRLLFTGDLAPIGIAEVKPGDSSGFKIDKELMGVLDEYDLRITNLECSLTTSAHKIKKTGPHLKAHPDSINTLKQLKIDVACLSNNHIRDFDDQGVMDTLHHCQRAGIKTLGAGKNLQEAAQPLYLNIENKIIALLNFSESEYNEASAQHAGSNPDQVIHIVRSVFEARKSSDYQIVILHGGKEMHPYPTPYQVELFRFIAELGVHAVIGHHTHVIGGYEYYQGIPLVYSLGNFLFDEDGNPDDWYHGALAGLNFDTAGNTSVHFHHIELKDNTLSLLPHKESKEFIQAIDLNICEKAWNEVVEKESYSVIKGLLNLSKLKRGLLKLGVGSIGNHDRYLMSLGNKIRCKTHQQLTLDAIKNYSDKK